jgi:hypothetical protein
MVEEPPLLKQLYLNHVCEIGLRQKLPLQRKRVCPGSPSAPNQHVQILAEILPSHAVSENFPCHAQYVSQSTYIYIKSTTVTVYVPSLELGLSQSQPLSRQRVCPSPRTEGGPHSPAGEGLGEPQFRRLEKKLSTLPTLW